MVTRIEAISMSSKEIADLTGKRHDNVVRDIRKMFTHLEINPLTFEGTFRDGMNRLQTEYRLDKDLTLTLIAGYRADLRLTIHRTKALVMKDLPHSRKASRIIRSGSRTR